MKNDPFEYIRNYYGVPARRGQRVEITVRGVLRQGAISGTSNQYIKVRFDGDPKPFKGVFHPTDGVKYLAAPTPAVNPANHIVVHNFPTKTLREVYDTMEAEQRTDFDDYVRRCGGVPFSKVNP